MHKLAAIFGTLILFVSLNSDTQRKRIRQGDYDIVCYVYIEPLEKFNKKKEYFWFKSGEVHNSFAQAGGLVLHEDYKKYYRSKQLAEHGRFYYGLKDGEWRDWYENGKLKTVTNWANGYKSGYYAKYDENGNIETLGTYKKNRKANRWINYKTADTTYFKNDSIYSEKPESKTSKFFSRLFEKRDSLKVAKKRMERLERRQQDSIKRDLKRKERQEKRRQDSIQKVMDKN